MNVQLRHLDRILLVFLEGPVVEADLVKLTGYLNTLASKLSAILFDLHAAQIEPEVASVVTRLKTQYERNRIKFLIVTPDLIGADSARMTDAIASLKSVESDRVLEVFAKDEELAKVEKAILAARRALALAVGVAAARVAEVSDVELDRALKSMEERNAQFRNLFKTLSSEILALQDEGAKTELPDSSDPGAVIVAEAKRRALDQVGAARILD